MAAPAPPIRPQLAVSAAIFRGPDVLLVRRAHPPGQGLYSLPGGRVEFGESLAVALQREVAEETSLGIEIVALAGIREVLPSPGQPGHYVVLSYAARWLAGDPVLNDEHDDVRWMPPDAIARLPVTEGLIPILAAARLRLGL
jgi:ADP-ribose pyrophosphatase YjhB (NUDIX family)